MDDAPAPAAAAAPEPLAPTPLRKSSAQHRARKPTKLRRVADGMVAKNGASRVRSVSFRHTKFNGDQSSPAVADDGRARRSWAQPARAPGVGCAECATKIAAIKLRLHVARRTMAERKLVKNKTFMWNYERVKRGLAEFAFDANGNFECCSACIGEAFDVGPDFIASAHKLARARRDAPFAEATKADFDKDPKLVARLILPPEFDGSPLQYVRGLSVSDKAMVGLPLSSHGGAGKPPNSAKRYDYARVLFGQFVKANRSPTGRTADSNGRTHGAQYYLSCGWTQLRQRTEADRVGSNRPLVEIFSHCVIEAMTAEVATQKLCEDEATRALAASARIPSHVSIERWLKRDFGKSSEAGSTVLHPHKTDACSQCCETANDLASLLQSLKREQSQPEKTAERLRNVEVLNQCILDTKAAHSEHLAHAARAKENYTAKSNAARAEYVAVTELWNDIRKRHADGTLDAAMMLDAARRFARAELVMEHDYQQDKFWPSWNASPQPGPTYFMSHYTAYVHIILSPSLGNADDETKLHRNRMYVRGQCVGNKRLKLSKDSNDTVSTINHFLSGAPTTGFSPPIYRTGYGPLGRL